MKSGLTLLFVAILSIAQSFFMVGCKGNVQTPRGPSWQARALEAYMIVKKRFSPSPSSLDVAWERANVESMAGMFKPMGAIQCDSVELAPEHPFPAAVEDAVAAYGWLLSQGYAPGKVVVAGDSAGGNLALALLVYLRDRRRPLPAAAVCLSPNPDLTYSSESWVFNSKKDVMIDARKERQAVEIYLRGADPRSPLASPYFADLRGLPPLLIQVGSREVLLSDAMLFAEKARLAGVEVTLEVWPGMQHEWHFAAKLMPEGRRAIARIGEFVEAVFRKSR